MCNELRSPQCQCACRFRIDPVEADHQAHLAKGKIKDGKAKITGFEEQILPIEEVNFTIKSDEARGAQMNCKAGLPSRQSRKSHSRNFAARTG